MPPTPMPGELPRRARKPKLEVTRILSRIESDSPSVAEQPQSRANRKRGRGGRQTA